MRRVLKRYRVKVTCPQGAVSSSWTPARNSKGTNIIIARFTKATCQPCPARARCTTAVRSGRQLGFRHRPIHEALTAARTEQAGETPAAPVPHPRRDRGHHRPGHPRHRHPPRPLPRPAENPPGAQHRSRRHQPDPARRLVDRQAAGPDPDHPPAAAGPRSIKPESMTTNKPTGSGMAPMGRSGCSNYFSELERSSRLGLTWGNGAWVGGCPQVKRALPTLSGGCRSGSGGSAGAGRVRWLAVPAGVGFGDGEAEVLEFGDELAQAAVVVEPGAVVGELVVGQDAGGGLAVFLAGPLVVGAVQPGRVGVAAAVRAGRSGSSGRRGCRAGRSPRAAELGGDAARPGPAGPGWATRRHCRSRDPPSRACT